MKETILSFIIHNKCQNSHDNFKYVFRIDVAFILLSEQFSFCLTLENSAAALVRERGWMTRCDAGPD